MQKPSWRSNSLAILNEYFRSKKAAQRKQKEEALADFIIKEKERVYEIRTGSMKEDISDEIIEWLTEWYQRVQWFDYFPTEDAGGSALIVQGETQTIEEFLNSKEDKRKKTEKYKNDPSAKAKVNNQ